VRFGESRCSWRDYTLIGAMSACTLCGVIGLVR
jgi:hypothetical protein